MIELQIVFSMEDINADNPSLIRGVTLFFVADQRSGTALKIKHQSSPHGS